MKIDTFTISCVFTSDATVSFYKGSALRGAFGHALKKTCCALRYTKCSDCMLTASCAYSLIFESKKLNQNKTHYRIRLSSKPNPYVLEPPLDSRCNYKAGDSFSFTLKLFGPALNYRPQIIYALILMGKTGLGKQNRGVFRIKSISSNNQVIYDEDTNSLSMQDTSQELFLASEHDSCTSLTVDFLTPFRIKRNNVFQSEITFGTLIRAAMRRVSSLEEAYGKGEPDIDYRGLAQLADSIETVEDKTSWHDIPRYSSRQKTPMKLGGVQGSIMFKGDIAQFLPLLRYCEVMHIGKSTTFGLGMMRLEQ